MEDHTVLITTGAIGSLLLIIDSTIQMIKAGHIPSALPYCLLLSILCIDLWAVAPSQLEHRFPLNHASRLLWSLAITTYCWLLYRVVHRRSRSRSALKVERR